MAYQKLRTFKAPIFRSCFPRVLWHISISIRNSNCGGRVVLFCLPCVLGDDNMEQSSVSTEHVIRVKTLL